MTRNGRSKTMQPRSRRKPYSRMTTEELAAATARFDREDLTAPRPLRGVKQRRYQRARAKRGRPRIGRGSRAITITLERGLLERADRTARRERVTRSQLIAKALIAELAADSGSSEREGSGRRPSQS